MHAEAPSNKTSRANIFFRRLSQQQTNNQSLKQKNLYSLYYYPQPSQNLIHLFIITINQTLTLSSKK